MTLEDDFDDTTETLFEEGEIFDKEYGYQEELTAHQFLMRGIYTFFPDDYKTYCVDVQMELNTSNILHCDVFKKEKTFMVESYSLNDIFRGKASIGINSDIIRFTRT